ncbi:MAG: hypothetical protein ACK59C_05725, partial [Holosporales bacterium]
GKKKPESGGQLPKRPSRKAFFESTTQDSGEKEENSLPLVIAGSTKASRYWESKFNPTTGVPIPYGSRALIPPSPRFARRGRLGQIYKILLKLFTTPQAAEYPVFFIVRAGGKV